MKLNKRSQGIDISGMYPVFFTIIFVIVLLQYSFSALEAIFYDLRIKYDFGINLRKDIVTIVMDEESDEFLGEKYPYTYASHQRMISKLIKDEPAIINYFGALQEPENESERDYLLKFKSNLLEFAHTGGNFRFGTDMDTWGEQRPPFELQELGFSLALINIDNSTFAKDDISRRAILSISGESTLHLWTANKFRAKNDLEPLDSKSLFGSYYLREADANFVLYRFYGNPTVDSNDILRIPFHRVLTGNFPAGFFKDKIVLVGPSYISNSSDYILSPYSREEYKTPRLALHATIIESLLQDKTIFQVPRVITSFLCVMIALVLSITISRVNPTKGLIITICTILGILIIGFLIFSILGLWIYLSHLVLTVFVVYNIWVPFRAIAEYQTRYAIQEETKLLKQVENLKQNFISLMSHDLKTPVAKIAGMADVLRQKASDIDLKNGLTSIIDSTKELNRFITSILDLTKIESSNLSIVKTSKDVNKLIQQTVENLTFEAQNKNIKISLNLAPLYPIELDSTLMARVFSNLIENALKYSPEDSRVTITTWDDAQWVYIKIEDNGVGIPENDLKHIFDKFYRVKNDSIHKIKGTGLGLYLVKYFVELHGGTIHVTSSINKGTSFEIKLKNA